MVALNTEPQPHWNPQQNAHEVPGDEKYFVREQRGMALDFEFLEMP
jgi:hypothetical protein